jgi:hypothetical protein
VADLAQRHQIKRPRIAAMARFRSIGNARWGLHDLASYDRRRRPTTTRPMPMRSPSLRICMIRKVAKFNGRH